MRQNPTTVDIGTVLDDGPFSLAQKMAVLLAAFAIVMDGFDGQLIGFAIPVLIKEWGITRNAFAPAVAAGLIGMGLGSALAGLFADRFGRRWALVGRVFLFGGRVKFCGWSGDGGCDRIERRRCRRSGLARAGKCLSPSSSRRVPAIAG